MIVRPTKPIVEARRSTATAYTYLLAEVVFLSGVSERKAQQEVALVAICMQQGVHGITEVFVSSTCVPKFGTDTNPSGLKCKSAAKRETDIILLVELRRIVDFHGTQRTCRNHLPQLPDSHNVPKGCPGIDEWSDWSWRDLKLDEHWKFP